MTDITQESYEAIARKINNLLRNFKLINDKQKKSEEKILNLEKNVESLDEKIAAYAKEDFKFIKDLQNEHTRMENEIKDIDTKLINLDKEYVCLKESIALKQVVQEQFVSKIEVMNTDLENMKVSSKRETEISTSEEKNTAGSKNSCNKCDMTFNSKVKLKYHIRIHHPQILNCPECEEKFDENYKLENHMKSHSGSKTFQCDVCSSEFQLKWRLNKHKMGHQAQFKRKCHYYNNDKICPFMENGCKFAHEVSSECFFKENCTKDMCQFRHVTKC